MLKHSEPVLRPAKGDRTAHDCRRLSLTDPEHLTFEDVGVIVACPDCGRRWKVAGRWMTDLAKHPTWVQRRLPWPRSSSSREGRGGLCVD